MSGGGCSLAVPLCSRRARGRPSVKASSLYSCLLLCPCRLGGTNACARDEEKRTNPVERGGPTSWLLLARVQASLLSYHKKLGEPFWKDRKVLWSWLQCTWSLLTLAEIEDNGLFLHLFVLSPKPGNLTDSSVLRSIDPCFSFSINFGKNAGVSNLWF